jgi:hypothetical protein
VQTLRFAMSRGDLRLPVSGCKCDDLRLADLHAVLLGDLCLAVLLAICALQPVSIKQV